VESVLKKKRKATVGRIKLKRKNLGRTQEDVRKNLRSAENRASVDSDAYWPVSGRCRQGQHTARC